MKTKIAITLGAMALSAMSGAAYAAPLRSPVKRSAHALGAPLPEGVYFVNTGSYWRPDTWDDRGRTLTFDIPVIAWSTPWQLTSLANGRIEAYASGAG